MSSVRLCLAGLLVASGLVLGAFTLHGYFDPQWEAKQSRTADARPGGKVIPALHGRSRFVAREEKPPAAPVRVTTAGVPTPQNSPTKAAGTPSKPMPPRRKVADKTKAAPEQQASFVWPWNLFNN